MKKYFVGIDISKEKLDFCVITDSGVIDERIVENTIEGVAYHLKLLLGKGVNQEETLLCAEFTGQYGYPLCCACTEHGYDLWMEDPMQIKQRSGVRRGKDDKADAKKIAEYACRFQSCCRLYDLPSTNLVSLKQLLSERDMYLSHKSCYKGQLSDQKKFMNAEDYTKKSKRLKALVKNLEKLIEDIDRQIDELIESDSNLKNQMTLLKSIDGVGDGTARKMIVVTNAFTAFRSPRQFCCYAGVAPFEYRSGSSIYTRKKVSQRADKSIKKLLHLAALSSIKVQGELHDYYVRKIEEGKNKMLVINAVRAKLVLRMFAVIKRNEPYEKKHEFSLV